MLILLIHSLNGIKLFKLMVLFVFQKILCTLITHHFQLCKLLLILLLILMLILFVIRLLLLLQTFLIILNSFLFNQSKLNFCNGIEINIKVLLRIELLFIYLNLVVNLMNLLLFNNIMNKFKLILILLKRINLMLFWCLFIQWNNKKVVLCLIFILFQLFNLI